MYIYIYIYICLYLIYIYAYRRPLTARLQSRGSKRLDFGPHASTNKVLLRVCVRVITHMHKHT